MKKMVPISILLFGILTIISCNQDKIISIDNAKNEKDTIDAFSNTIYLAYKKNYLNYPLNLYVITSHKSEAIVLNDSLYEFRLNFTLERYEGRQSDIRFDSIIVTVDRLANLKSAKRWNVPLNNVVNRQKVLEDIDLGINNLIKAEKELVK